MEEKNHKKSYKTLAIVFITLFVLSWVLFIGLINIGYDMQVNEDQCSINFCGKDVEAVSYSYDDMTEACYCYDSEQEITSAKIFSWLFIKINLFNTYNFNFYIKISQFWKTLVKSSIVYHKNNKIKNKEHHFRLCKNFIKQLSI